jgi:hypothetical protein
MRTRTRRALRWLIGLCLGLIASSASAQRALTWNVKVDPSVSLHNDTDVTITIRGVSDGVPFTFLNPAPGSLPAWPVSLPGDFVTFSAAGSARSGPAGIGDSTASAAMTIDALTPDQPATDGPGLEAAFAIAYLIEATGGDAFASVNGELTGTSPWDPDAAAITLLPVQAQADVVFGDTEDFLDLGTFGGPISREKLWIWPTFGATRPLAPGGERFATGTLTAFDAAIMSTASYEVSMTFGLSAVPEPTAAWLLGSALPVLGWIRRRKSAS